MCSRQIVQSELIAERLHRSKSEVGIVAPSAVKELIIPRVNSETFPALKGCFTQDNNLIDHFKSRILVSKITSLRQRITFLDYFIASTRELLARYDEKCEISKTALEDKGVPIFFERRTNPKHCSNGTRSSCSSYCSMGQLCKNKEFYLSDYSAEDDPAVPSDMKSASSICTDRDHQCLKLGSSHNEGGHTWSDQLFCFHHARSHGSQGTEALPMDAIPREEKLASNSHDLIKETHSVVVIPREESFAATSHCSALSRKAFSAALVPRNERFAANSSSSHMGVSVIRRSASNATNPDAQISFTSDYFSAMSEYSAARNSEFALLMTSLSRLNFSDFTASSLFKSHHYQFDSKPNSNQDEKIIVSQKRSDHCPASPGQNISLSAAASLLECSSMTISSNGLHHEQSLCGGSSSAGGFSEQILLDSIPEVDMAKSKHEEMMELSSLQSIEEGKETGLVAQEQKSQTYCHKSQQSWNSEEVPANKIPHSSKTQQQKKVQKGMKMMRKSLKKVGHFMRKINCVHFGTRSVARQ